MLIGNLQGCPLSMFIKKDSQWGRQGSRCEASVPECEGDLVKASQAPVFGMNRSRLRYPLSLVFVN